MRKVLFTMENVSTALHSSQGARGGGGGGGGGAVCSDGALMSERGKNTSDMTHTSARNNNGEGKKKQSGGGREDLSEVPPPPVGDHVRQVGAVRRWEKRGPFLGKGLCFSCGPTNALPLFTSPARCGGLSNTRAAMNEAQISLKQRNKY